MTRLLLSFLAIALMVADIYLTEKILSKGGKELNPFMRWCIDKLGENWMMPKVILTSIILVVCFTVLSALPLIAVCIVQSCIVLWNFKEWLKGRLHNG